MLGDWVGVPVALPAPLSVPLLHCSWGQAPRCRGARALRRSPLLRRGRGWAREGGPGPLAGLR